MKRAHPHHHKNQTDFHQMRDGRHLEELESQTSKPLVMSILTDDEAFCSTLVSESSCDSESDKCSWCTAGAVADKCHSIPNAKTLPPAVFKCSNLGAEKVEKKIEEPVKIVKDDESTCNALTSGASCNGLSQCSWCTAGAVADACHSIENAKRLPAAVF